MLANKMPHIVRSACSNAFFKAIGVLSDYFPMAHENTSEEPVQQPLSPYTKVWDKNGEMHKFLLKIFLNEIKPSQISQ